MRRASPPLLVWESPPPSRVASKAVSNIYLTIIPRTCVGYELLDSGRGAKHRFGYHKLISNKREWNNCFIKYQTLDKFTKISGILFPTGYRKIIVYINQSKSNCQLSQIMHDSVRLCARMEKRPFSNMCPFSTPELFSSAHVCLLGRRALGKPVIRAVLIGCRVKQ